MIDCWPGVNVGGHPPGSIGSNMNRLTPPTVRVLQGSDLQRQLPRLATQFTAGGRGPLSHHPAWLSVFRDGMDHDVYCLEAVVGTQTVGTLPLAYVRSLLFGKFLVSLPYLNTSGTWASDAAARTALVDRAVTLADELRVRYLELRHEQALDHTALTATRTDKVHMRLKLPSFPGNLWQELPAKVRNQIRKGQKNEFTVEWGTLDQLNAFYRVFSRNMRDLGTPVYGKRFFRRVLEAFPDRAELCVVSNGPEPIAGALLMHGYGITEVPSASSLREYNPTCANMLLYWHLLERAVNRGQDVFDFGRSTPDGNTFKFKKQWGAEAHPAAWQYYVREGVIGDMRPDHPRYRRAIDLWRRLPLPVTQFIGPAIVRGIP
jgi:FemAB-related protein (PEP-CTERM system-associated)